MWFPNRSDTNQAVQSQKQARGLKFRIEKEEEVYYSCSENKGADQLHCYREADLRLCFRICRLLFSHKAAQTVSYFLFQSTFQLPAGHQHKGPYDP